MINNEPEIFEIDGVKFRLHALSTVEGLKGLDLLSSKLLPMFSSAMTSKGFNEAAFFKELGVASAALPEVYNLFANNCDWHKGQGFVKISQFDMVFARRPALALAWLSKCLMVEYADFFAGGLDLLKDQVSEWSCLIGSIGGSGDSSSTQE